MLWWANTGSASWADDGDATLHLRRRGRRASSTRRTADGRDEDVYRVVCPVCGQLGPAIPAEGRDEAAAITEAVAAWNAMIARLRPLEA